jgi:putative ABC transport system substrate-binding protein
LDRNFSVPWESKVRFDQLRRRDILTLLCPTVLGGAAAWQLGAHAQASNLPTIGFLSTGSPRSIATYVAAFQHGLSELGYAEGRNVAIAYRWAEGHPDQLDMLANDLVGRRVKLIAASGGLVSAKAAKKATASIPILFVSGFDPVELGLVSSLSRPGGNATGASLFSTELIPKSLELLHGLGSRIRSVGVLLNPQSVTPDIEAKGAIAAAQLKGYQLHLFKANTASEIEAAFMQAAEQQVSAFLVTASPFFSRQRAQIVALAARHAMPVMYPWREYLDAGGLMSYGTELTWGYNLIGQYAGRILKGELPSDLPVQQPTKFELVINLKAAKALDLTIPETLLTIADRVIE